ncbi:MAG: hypothetical protein ACXIUM_15740 [Wenzhouxiangella sp.]
MTKPLCVLLALMSLAACSSDSEQPDLLAPQREAMERAEDVERVLQDAAAQRQRRLDEQAL